MSETKVVSPDLDFVRKLTDAGGDTLKHCMQCANCSVACELSPEDDPFPRKEMILAQWGQKDELLTDPDIWLCFGCTDCSIQCPRGARPGDVMAAVRKEAIRKFSPFGAIQKLLESPRSLPILLAVPIVIWGAFWAIFGGGGGDESYFEGIFPPHILEPVLGAMTTLGMLLFLVGAVRYWKALSEKHPAAPGASFVGSWIGAFRDVITHAKFRKCESGGSRALGHMLMFYGFGLIFLGGTVVGMGAMFTDMKLPIDHPENAFFPWKLMKIFLNVGAVMLIVGTIMLLHYRLTRPERQMRGTWYDWFFIVALLGAGVTGLLTEILRWIDLKSLAFGVYFIHLVVVFCLLGYAPWSKIAHLVYRTVALAHARFTGRERPVKARA